MFQVKIVQWNCFKLSIDREIELKLFNKEHNPYIVFYRFMAMVHWCRIQQGLSG